MADGCSIISVFRQQAVFVSNVLIKRNKRRIISRFTNKKVANINLPNISKGR